MEEVKIYLCQPSSKVNGGMMVSIIFIVAIVSAISFSLINNSGTSRSVNKKEQVHYHAIFQVYIDNKLINFGESKYMHVQYCTQDEKTREQQEDEQAEKTHLHDNVGDIVHVHRNNVTWGDLFINLKYQVPGEAVGYINSEKAGNIFTTKIKPDDRVLILIEDNTDIQGKLDKLPSIDRIRQEEKKRGSW